MNPKITGPINTAFDNAAVNQKKTKIDDGTRFGDHLKKYLSEVNELQQVADTKIEELAAGQNANLHETMIAVEQANVSFRVMMAIRSKIVSAYEEVMRMGI